MSPKLQFAILATDVVIFKLENDQLKALLIKAKSPHQNQWATPGSLIGPQESLEAAARRNLTTFISDNQSHLHLEQLFTFGNPQRDPTGRVVSVAYLALVPPVGHQVRPSSDYPELAWFPITALPSLAYDHADIIATALERLQAKLGYTNIIYSLMPKEFTLTELQSAYQIALNHRLDKRNFRKKIATLKLLTKLPRKRRGEAHRPAQLYSFTHQTPQVVEIL